MSDVNHHANAHHVNEDNTQRR